MNRLFLIGNGFDLAHKLETGYNHFIKWYLKQALDIAVSKNYYTDPLIEISVRQSYKTTPFDDPEKYIDYFYEDGLINCTSQSIRWKNGPYYNNCENPYIVRMKSDLLERLFSQCSTLRWVDIENEYYLILKSILRQHHSQLGLKELNDSLATLIEFLANYLSNIKPTHLNAGYQDVFDSNILRTDVVPSMEKDIKPSSSLILNFNYTSTVEEYLNNLHFKAKKRPIDVNYIHGKLNHSKNPIIFGFGDELDQDYHALELAKNNEFFRYMKSFWYFKTSNYKSLVRFLEAEPYQIVILGHSCGLSDRTLLNMIFEHPNCLSIKIYYYQNSSGEDNYEDLTHEISRHFKDKVKMRRVVVEKNNSQPMPQVEI